MTEAQYPQNAPKEEGYYWVLLENGHWDIVVFTMHDRGGELRFAGCEDVYFLNTDNTRIKRWSRRILPPTEENLLLPLTPIRWSNTSLSGITEEEIRKLP